MKTYLKSIVLVLLTMVGTMTGATDLARKPLGVHGAVPPNVIFGMDDSGSMDMETLLQTNEGLFWWHESNQSGWDSSGKFYVNPAGLNSSTYTSYFYLFPAGCSDSESGGATRRLCDSTGVAYALPPTPQFAALRSAAYNPVFYNPATTYKPWAPATVSGVERTFGNSSPTAAKLHPLFDSTIDLTATQSSTASNWTFRALSGMRLPKGTLYYASRRWNTLSSDATVGTGTLSASSYDVSVPYYPAAYWHKEACTVNGVTCVSAPDSGTLKLYEIKATTTKYPSGRTYAQELQNFANWFTYYRKRKLMLAASMAPCSTNSAACVWA